MKSRKLLAAVVLLATAFGPPSSGPDKLVFEKAGFAIAALDSVPGKAPAPVLHMYLPATDAFAPNVCVVVQPYTEGIDAYLALTKKELEQMTLEVVAETRPAKTVAAVEYKGVHQGKKLHYYARIVEKDGQVFLATATALQSQWKEVGERLKACVDSLAPVGTAVPTDAGNSGAPADAQKRFSVVLKNGGANKIQVIKVVREITGLGLKEAKDMVDQAPKPVKEGLSRQEGEALAKRLRDVGADVGSDSPPLAARRAAR